MKELLKYATRNKVAIIGDLLMIANIALHGYMFYNFIKSKKQENKQQHVEEVADAEKQENS